jgi:hypothetical protein
MRLLLSVFGKDEASDTGGMLARRCRTVIGVALCLGFLAGCQNLKARRSAEDEPFIEKLEVTITPTAGTTTDSDLYLVITTRDSTVTNGCVNYLGKGIPGTPYVVNLGSNPLVPSQIGGISLVNGWDGSARELSVDHIKIVGIDDLGTRYVIADKTYIDIEQHVLGNWKTGDARSGVATSLVVPTNQSWNPEALSRNNSKQEIDITKLLVSVTPYTLPVDSTDSDLYLVVTNRTSVGSNRGSTDGKSFHLGRGTSNGPGTPTRYDPIDMEVTQTYLGGFTLVNGMNGAPNSELELGWVEIDGEDATGQKWILALYQYPNTRLGNNPNPTNNSTPTFPAVVVPSRANWYTHPAVNKAASK